MIISSQIIDNVISSIRTIRPEIHRIILSGDYNYKDYYDKYSSNMKDLSKNKNNNSYKKHSYINIKGNKLSLITFTNDTYKPNSRIEFNFKNIYNKKILLEMFDNYPKLRISSIEYAVDFYCEEDSLTENVRNLFFLFVKYLYIKKQKETKIYLSNSQSNYTYYIGKLNKYKYYKVYERGDDEKRIKNGGWNYEDINKLRLEYTLQSNEIINYNLNNFNNFLKNTRFEELIENKIHFAKFKNGSHKDLPKEWQEYNTEINGEIIDSFQQAYINHKSGTVKNINQSITNMPSFDNFKKDILKKCAKFENRWSKIFV